jgi:hypothetical protein
MREWAEKNRRPLPEGFKEWADRKRNN